MPSQKRARRLRDGDVDRREAVRAASAARDRELAELRLKYQPRIAQLEIEYAEKRRQVWKAYDERCRLISSAHILRAGA